VTNRSRQVAPPFGWTEASRIPDVPSRLSNLPVPGKGQSVADKAPLTRIIYPVSVEKLPTSQDFNRQDFAMVLAAGTGSLITSANLSFQLPQGVVGWLQQFSIYILTPTANTSVQWTLRINQGPVSGWDNLQNSPGVANLYREDYSDLRVPIPNGGLVDVLITNLNVNGPWTVGGKISGWYHSYAAEQAVSGEDSSWR
jgi:hypothetical protein